MTQQRFEIYRPVHKAMRHILFSTSRAIGLTDFRDGAAPQETQDNLTRTVSMLREHAEHESVFVHPHLESNAPGIAESFNGNHDDDEAAYDELARLAGQVQGADGDRRVQLGKRIYDCFNAYLGEYLGHLEREQTELQQALWDHFTDEEAIAMEQAIVGSVQPERMEMYMQGMCASYNPDDILPFLNGIKAGGPPPSFSATCLGWLNK